METEEFVQFLISDTSIIEELESNPNSIDTIGDCELEDIIIEHLSDDFDIDEISDSQLEDIVNEIRHIITD